MACILKWVLLACMTHCLADFEYGQYRAVDYFDPGIYNYNYIWRKQNAKTKASAKEKSITNSQKTQKSKTQKKSTTPIIRNLEESYFQALESYGVKATPISEKTYPWIAKVVHSQKAKYPYVCTASCVERRIFITAGRCLVNLKLAITSVIYQNYQLPAKVFVLPSKPSKQMYDDIGIIVVENGNYKGDWPTVKVFNDKRTDDQYKWFADLKYEKTPYEHKAIGYVAKKGIHKFKSPTLDYVLSEVEVVIDIDFCSKLLSARYLKNAFYVPSYFGCTLKEAMDKKVICQTYLGTEGAAVLHVKTNTLLGVATWGTNSMQVFELPVGFSVPNSDNYYKDIACARTLRDDKQKSPQKGYYQKLCKK